jgi:hypothetical protein
MGEGRVEQRSVGSRGGQGDTWITGQRAERKTERER